MIPFTFKEIEQLELGDDIIYKLDNGMEQTVKVINKDNERNNLRIEIKMFDQNGFYTKWINCDKNDISSCIGKRDDSSIMNIKSNKMIINGKEYECW